MPLLELVGVSEMASLSSQASIVFGVSGLLLLEVGCFADAPRAGADVDRDVDVVTAFGRVGFSLPDRGEGEVVEINGGGGADRKFWIELQREGVDVDIGGPERGVDFVGSDEEEKE